MHETKLHKAFLSLSFFFENFLDIASIGFFLSRYKAIAVSIQFLGFGNPNFIIVANSH